MSPKFLISVVDEAERLAWLIACRYRVQYETLFTDVSEENVASIIRI
jgi:hypothetical protein